MVRADFPGSNPHGSDCVTCHGGVNGRLTKEEAHAGMVADPSAGDASSCKQCHQGVFDKHAKSLHGTQNGYLTMFHRRGASPEGQVQSMFQARCSGCHTSCGQCHVSRPNAVKGGLVSGHKFLKTPSQSDNCTACHGSRIHDEFTGKNKFQNASVAADTHYLHLMNCFSCHTEQDAHGDGTTPATRYDVEGAPGCLDCHPTVESDSNLWHTLHARNTSQTRLQCQVCHSQPYKNCYSCHVKQDSQGIRFPSQIDFRIGRNPNVTEKRPWDYVVLRHIPIAPDSFEPWGITITDYTAEPTWRFTTPHNIKKRTTQSYPDGYPDSATCSANCHGNEDLFLTEGYINSKIQEGVMVSEEVQANQPVVVTLTP